MRVGLQRGQHVAPQLHFLGNGAFRRGIDNWVFILDHLQHDFLETIFAHADDVADPPQGPIVFFPLIDGHVKQEPHEEGLGFLVPKRLKRSLARRDDRIRQHHGVFADVLVLRVQPVHRVEARGPKAGDAPGIDDMKGLLHSRDLACPVSVPATGRRDPGIFALGIDDDYRAFVGQKIWDDR